MIEPSYTVIPFESDTQKLEMLKRWDLASPQADKAKQLYYKGMFAPEYTPCDVVGYSDNVFVVISINGHLHSVHPDYLAEIQPNTDERMELVRAFWNRDSEQYRKKRPHKGNSKIFFPENCVIFDTETTGLCPGVDSVIEFAGLRIRDSEIVERYSTLVNPGFPVSDFISSFTGITNTMLEAAPCMKDVALQIRNFIGDDLLVGHNVNFDINFLYDEFSRHSVGFLTNDYMDTLRIAKKALPNLAHHTLSDVAAALAVPQSSAHRAMVDCETTFSCLIKLKPAILRMMTNAEPAPSCSERNRYYTHSGYDLRNISPRCESCDASHPLYGKICVFTGDLTRFSRLEAAQLVADCGGIPANNVTKKTDYLILGNNEYNPLVRDGISNKQRKAESYILAGCDIKIIPEAVFLDLLAGVE